MTLANCSRGPSFIPENIASKSLKKGHSERWFESMHTLVINGKTKSESWAILTHYKNNEIFVCTVKLVYQINGCLF